MRLNDIKIANQSIEWLLYQYVSERLSELIAMRVDRILYEGMRGMDMIKFGVQNIILREKGTEI